MGAPFSNELVAFMRTQLHYDPETGIFTWLRSGNNAKGKFKIGDRAGSAPRVDRYTDVGSYGLGFKAHILAYWFQTGQDVPKGLFLDHIDRNRSNNKWGNLRVVTGSKNNHNADPTRANTSGVRGVHRATGRKYWGARININGEVILLGSFTTFEETVQARLHAEMKYLGEITSKHVAHLYDPKADLKSRGWLYPSVQKKRKAAAELEKQNADKAQS